MKHEYGFVESMAKVDCAKRAEFKREEKKREEERHGDSERNQEEKQNKIQHCFATTNVVFWENKNLWEIPRE